MRTFHIGGTESRVIEQTRSMHGIRHVHYEMLTVWRRIRKAAVIVMNRNGRSS